MKLILHPDNILQKSVSEFDFENPIIDPKILEEQMVKLMIDSNGIGLSANQVGLDARVFVMRSENLKDVFTPFAVFNPKILECSLEQEVGEEGCLSFPGLFFKVKRPSKILVEFFDRDKNNLIIQLEGIDSRCFQHELDHLNGICFTDRISKLKLNLAQKKLRKQNGRTQQRSTISI